MKDFEPPQKYSIFRVTYRKFTTFFACSAEQLAQKLHAPPQSSVTKKYVCELGVIRFQRFLCTSNLNASTSTFTNQHFNQYAPKTVIPLQTLTFMPFYLPLFLDLIQKHIIPTLFQNPIHYSKFTAEQATQTVSKFIPKPPSRYNHSMTFFDPYKNTIATLLIRVHFKISLPMVSKFIPKIT
jgi:hypothetical protein